jgi:hypothetical protein
MARRMRRPALAALLALSCQRSLMPLGPSSNPGGAGGSRTNGRDAGSPTGGNGGSTTTGAGGNGGSTAAGAGGSTTTGAGGNGGSVAVDGGVDRAPPDAGKDAGVDRSADVVTPGCPVDCTHLPHVLPDAIVSCVKGKCAFASSACEPGFANCSGSGSTGCETDISADSSCGSCFFKCVAPQTCRPLNTGGFLCGYPCSAQFPDACDVSCVDLKNDVNNCGSCGNTCYLPNANVACQGGKCLFLSCSDPQWADCNSDPGCETPLGTTTDCGGCGDPACTTANTLFTCADSGSCNSGVCTAGFANCNTANPDCETTFASPPASGGCLPHYVGTFGIATQRFNNAVTAIASDGSFFLAGTYQGAVDFDPSANRDVRMAADPDGYVTKFNADGSYAWTATFAGRGEMELNSLALTPSGGVVVAGFYSDTIDFDPGAGSDLHFTATVDQPDPYVVELAANGTLVWARTFAGAAGSYAVGVGVAVDTAGAVYTTGSFFGTVDFDPGTGVDDLSAAHTDGFVVKLTAAGNLAWAKTFDNGSCDAFLNAIAVAKDGNVWATGNAVAGDGCTLASSPSDTQPNDVLLVRIGPGGDILTVRTFGNLLISDTGVALAASPDGTMYLLGSGGGGETIFDPGPPPIQRWLATNGGASFVLKLDAAGKVVWVSPMNGPSLSTIAATADGGVLAAGGGVDVGSFVTRLTAAGASVWSFALGGESTGVLFVSSASNSFLVSGSSSGTADFDPGPAIDPVFGDITFVSRFTF